MNVLLISLRDSINCITKCPPPDCKSPLTDAKVRFSKAFEEGFLVMLREIKSETLADMQTNANAVEANRLASSKHREKDVNAKKRMKSREEGASSSKTKYEEHEIDEIIYLLRNLSNRISRMESQPRVTQLVENRPQVKYRRPFQPQIFQIPNNDQQIQPPLLIDDKVPEETIHVVTNYINQFEDSSSHNDIVPINQDQGSTQNQESSQISTYQVFF